MEDLRTRNRTQSSKFRVVFIMIMIMMINIIGTNNASFKIHPLEFLHRPCLK